MIFFDEHRKTIGKHLKNNAELDTRSLRDHGKEYKAKYKEAVLVAFASLTFLLLSFQVISGNILYL